MKLTHQQEACPGMLDIAQGISNGEASAADAAYEILKERIVTAVARPGSIISDARLASELSMGRTPIREALQRLARERLITIAPRRGSFVSELQVFELQQIFEVRVELEGLCARLAAERAVRKDIDALREIIAREDAAHQEGDSSATIPLDRQLHDIIIDAAHNEYLGTCLTPLRNISTRAWYLIFSRYGHIAETRLEHRAIVEAIVAKNPDTADAAMREHVLNFRDKLSLLN